MRKRTIIIELETASTDSIITQMGILKIEAPQSWGTTIAQVAQRLAKELNNDDETFIVINDKVIRRIRIENASVKYRSIN